KVPRTGLSWLRGLEAAAFLALWCAVSWLAFQPETPPPPFTPQPYMLFALLAWGAMRFGLRVVGVSLALVAAIALTSAPVLQGPFLLGGETPTGRLLQAQIFLGALSLTGLLLAVLTTERRRAEKSLRASEARGRAVFEHASIAISQGDAEGRILDANPAFLKLWGYSLEELRGVRWIDLTHPEDRAESLGESQRLLAGEIDGFALEKRYVRKDGQLVWASVNVGSMRNASGPVEMLVLVAEDITPRKAAEQARAEREELFQAMFENNKTVQFLVDPETSAIIDANSAAAECYGYSREELRNLSIADINTLPPEQLRSIMAEVKHQGAEFRFVHRLKDGSLREVEVRTEPFVAGGRTLLLSTINDITDRLRAEDALRETEERLRLLIEVMDEGVVLTTPASTLKYVNPAFARLFGQEPAALEGWRYMDLLAPETAAGQPERLAARRKGSREPYEAKFLRTDGSGVLALVTPFPLFSREGEYQGSCAIIRDITQARAREMAEQLRRIRRNALLRLHEMPAASRQELLDFALEQVQALTMSPVGYIYAYDDTRRQFMLYSWSEGVMAQCAVQDKQIVYDLDATGLWGDAVRLREPVLLNDFAAADPRKKGYPEGHVPLSRFLTLPVIRAGRVVAVVGVANKTAPYDEEDVTQLRLFTDGLWSVLERQDAQAELNAVSERFHLAVRAGRIGLWDWDLVSGAMHCDAYMERSFGLSQHDLTGTPEDWLCRVHVEDRPRVREALEMARATGKRFEQSFRVARPDGAVVHQDSLAVTYQGPQDEPLRMVGVVIDVTRQRLAEEQVAESHRFLQTVIDTLPMPFACKDREGRYLLVNTAFAQLYGTTAEDILGRTMPEFAPPERAALHAAYDERLLSAPSSPPLEYETSYAPPGGSLRHWLVLKSHLPLTGGRKPGLAAITLDITERKRAEEALRQSEERFRDLFVDAPLPYQSMDEDGNLLLANDAWLATLGYQREEVIGKNFSEFLHPDWVAHFRKNFPVFKEIGLITGVEFTMRRKDGSTLLASFNGRVSRDEQGRFIRTHCTFQDITERRQAEEALRGAKAEAEAATLAKAQFLANMSHEIRTPLGGVIGAAQLLAKSRLSHDQRQLADMAVESGRALLSIVNDILDFSKIEAGRLDLRPAPFALRAGLEAVAAPFRLLAGQRGLSLALSIDPGVPDALVGDLGRLEQVLRNLLGNAVKFTETGSITLEVGPDQACPAPQGAACLRFIVRDTGIGIDPDFLPHLFESFSQADGSYGKRHGGTGLGLAISRSLMERMGGSLAVTSTVGAGSAFSFTLCLPLAGEGQRSAEEAASPYPAGAQTRQTRPLRVLLAEDNEIGRMLLERMLKDAGHTTVSVGNGREVLDALGREAFDLVLMDVQMPEVDGVSATQSIRQGQAGPQNVDIPIVALTAYAQDTDRQRFLAAGMDDYL
ncbi:MAG: PAS domain S-box protein, partial [Humidesulfovibrio sp.]|nr:PAS domain S-box protein [Humidesulfovibrio sp.]